MTLATDFGFAPASRNERIVFGAQRPGYPFRSVTEDQVQHWLAFMKDNGIQRVCCLLSRKQLDCYDDLLGAYCQAFGAEKVCWAPIDDFHLADEAMYRDKEKNKGKPIPRDA